ncbi:hypothetical protein HPB52_006240 [Rhipicephalus sanguineus]|uniref:UBC core domain-containing protein n=1 Tax=Rhipicephalus sanguineus TaxID=34632 RepID=A0A9D4PQT8_RHISA|nr:hypothetical protein HPB52_006240 [Rhipicephalus sanguineus]
MSLVARDRKEASTDDTAMRRDEAPENDRGNSSDNARQDLEATEDAGHGGRDESLHIEQSESGAQVEGAGVDTDDAGQSDAVVTVHRSPRWHFSGRLKPRSRNRGAYKPVSIAAAALRKLFRGKGHWLSTGVNHSEPKKKKESAEGGSRLLSLCAGKASSERGPAEHESPYALGSAARGGGDTTADASLSFRTTRRPRNREIRRQQTRGQQPSFTVDLVEYNLYEWHVYLYQVDPESPLWSDMQDTGVSCVQLSVSFPENFPFAPPFVPRRLFSLHHTYQGVKKREICRYSIVSDSLVRSSEAASLATQKHRAKIPSAAERGFVMEGGAICKELLTSRGWASAYTVEAILVQLAASLSEGQARMPTKPAKQFNRKPAWSSYRSLVKTRDKHGWVTPPLADG